MLACHLDTVVPWSPQWSSCWYSVHSSSPEWCGTAAECMPSFCSRCTVVFAVLPETDPAHSAARLTTPCIHCSHHSLHTLQPVLLLPAHSAAPLTTSCTYSIVCCHKTISVRIREAGEGRWDRQEAEENHVPYTLPHGFCPKYIFIFIISREFQKNTN